MSVNTAVEKASMLLPGLPVCILSLVRVLELHGSKVVEGLASDANILEAYKVMGAGLVAVSVLFFTVVVLVSSELLHVFSLNSLLVLEKLEKTPVIRVPLKFLYSSKAIEKFSETDRKKALIKYMSYYAVAWGCVLSVILECTVFRSGYATATVVKGLIIAGAVMILCARIVSSSVGKNFQSFQE